MMAFNVRQMPADRAAALIGEDDVAVFSQRLETMAATSQLMEASVSVPCDEYVSDHLPNNPNLDNCCP